MNSMRPKKRFGGFSFYLILMLVIFAMTYFMSNMSSGKGYTLSEVRSLIENEKVESVVINGSSLKMVMKSVSGQPQEVITKEIPLESIGDYEKYLAESADKGLIKSYDYNRPTDISAILNILICDATGLDRCLYLYQLFPPGWQECYQLRQPSQTQ